MNKEKVKRKIDSYLQKRILDLENEVYDKVKSSAMQCSDINDMDSHSQQFQVLEDERNINVRLNHIIDQRKHLQNIPVIKADIVKEGALLEIKNLFIFVGIVTPVISNDSKDIIGISTAAPIYKTLQNQSVGFQFKFAGDNCEILTIN